MYFIHTEGGHPVGEVKDVLTNKERDAMDKTLRKNVNGLPKTCKTVLIQLFSINARFSTNDQHIKPSIVFYEKLF